MKASESTFERVARQEGKNLDQKMAREALLTAADALLFELIEAKYPLTIAILNLSAELTNEDWRYRKPDKESA